MTTLACPACAKDMKRGKSASSGEVCFTDYLCERCGYRGKSIEMMDDWFLDAAHAVNTLSRLMSKRELVVNLARECVDGRLFSTARPVMVIWNEDEVRRYRGPYVEVFHQIIDRRTPVYPSGEDDGPILEVVRRYSLPVNAHPVQGGGICYLAEGGVGPQDLVTGAGKRHGDYRNPRFGAISFTVEGVDDGQRIERERRKIRARGRRCAERFTKGSDVQG